VAKVNLDEMRAARAENAPKSDAPKVVFKGKTFTLPLELPFGVFLRLGELESDESGEKAMPIMRELVEALFAKRAGEFLALGPSFDDLMALMTHLTDAYGIDPKASASSDS
jgi:hypothetical protein